jgi:hypothetical protein
MPLLSAVLVAANVLTGMATCFAVCSSTRLATDDCCKRPEAGISAPRCCQGAEQMAAKVTPAATSSRGQLAAGESAPLVVFAIPAADASSVDTFSARLVSTAAPPGATTLVGKRTSLLL